jgi:hypothetical protein
LLGDFIREAYWSRYSAGLDVIPRDDAHAFVVRAVADGKGRIRWSETNILRVSQYVLGACADFGASPGKVLEGLEAPAAKEVAAASQTGL